MFQLPPKPTKKPPFACTVTAIVARVMFSVSKTVGGGTNDPAVPVKDVPVSSVMLSLFGTKPFSSALTRMKLRDGNPIPVPHCRAPEGASKPSGLPRNIPRSL